MSEKVFNIIARIKNNDECFYYSDGILFQNENEVQGFLTNDLFYGQIENGHLCISFIYVDILEGQKYQKWYKSENDYKSEKCDGKSVLIKLDDFDNNDGTDENHLDKDVLEYLRNQIGEELLDDELMIIEFVMEVIDPANLKRAKEQLERVIIEAS